MEVRAGYKQTEAGVIPEDWDGKPLAELGHWKGGATPSMKNPKYWSNGTVPWASSGDVKSVLISDTPMKITASAVKETSTTLLPSNSIMIVTRSGILRKYLPVAKNTRPLAINQDIKALIPNNSALPDYLLHLLIGNGPRILATCLKAGTTVESIESPWLKAFHVPIPPTKAEQEAIAEALSDADALIETLEQVLAKKRQLKQGVMQQLLTGKKRLPGFSEEWETKALRKVIQIPVTDGPHLTPRFLNDGVPFLSVNNLVDNRIDLSNLRYISREDHDEFSRKCRPQKRDLLLGKAASVGRVAIVDTDVEFNIWSPIALIRVNGDNIPRFVYYSFQTEMVTRQIELLTNSSSQGNIGMGDIERLVFLLPKREEQRAVSNILSDMDAEIAALETKLAKVRMVKQGMMQELLTGRIRLV